MRFRLFGIPVQVQPWFWLTTVLLGLPTLMSGRIADFAIWVVVLLFAVVVHEMGHALAILQRGGRPDITLHAMGGTTSWGASLSLSRPQQAFISFAGPLAGFVVAGLVFAFAFFSPVVVAGLPRLVQLTLNNLLWVNLLLGLLNLAPVLPFDGGHILEAALGPKRADWTAGISQLFGILFTVGFLTIGATWGALLFGMSTFQSYQQNPGVLRRLWLKIKLRRLESQAEGLRGSASAPARRKPGAPPLRVIQGGADKPRDRRDLN